MAMTSTFDQISLLLGALEPNELEAYVCGMSIQAVSPPQSPLLYSLSFKCAGNRSALLLDRVTLKIVFSRTLVPWGKRLSSDGQSWGSYF